MSLIFRKRSGHASERKEVTVKLGVEWTHKLTISFYRMPWSDYYRAEVAFRDIIIPAINAFEDLIAGFEYAGYFDLRWDDWQCDVYYREKGSPAIHWAAILAAIAGIAIGAGLICLALAWFRREVRIEKTTMKKSELLEQGLITEEQYTELVKAETEEPAPWEKVVVFGLAGLLILGALLVLPRVIPERKPKPPEYY